MWRQFHTAENHGMLPESLQILQKLFFVFLLNKVSSYFIEYFDLSDVMLFLNYQYYHLW